MGFWERLRRAQMPSHFYGRIDDTHVLTNGKNSNPWLGKSSDFYFELHIREIWLSKKRKWYKKYEPMVTLGSEFIYDGKTIEVPYIVGPVILEKYVKNTPDGMIYSNLRVIGPHPYRGKPLRVGIILQGNEKMNYVKEVLKIVENANNVFPLSSMLGTYLQLTNTILDGLELVFELGKTIPMVGKISDHDLPNRAGYYVMTNADDKFGLDKKKLWVIDDKLYYGDDQNNSQLFKTKFRDYDYILFSINLTEFRTDLTALSFNKMYENVMDEVLAPNKDWVKDVQPKLSALVQAIHSSPDLTDSQIASLKREYAKKLKEEWLKKDDVLKEPVKMQIATKRKVSTSINKILKAYV